MATACWGRFICGGRSTTSAIAQAERAVALAPNDADGYETLAEILDWSGKPEESIRLIHLAMRLNPHYPFFYRWTLGHAYYLTERPQEALDTLAGSCSKTPTSFRRTPTGPRS